MTEQRGSSPTQFNVIADFADADSARRAIVDLERKGVEAGRISMMGIDDRAATEGESEMYAKDYGTVSHVGKRLLGGAVAGSVVGAIAGVIVASVADLNAVLMAAAGIVVVGALGGLWGGYTNIPVSGEAFEETYDLRDTSPQLAVRTDDEGEFAKAVDVLGGSGAISVQRLDREGHHLSA